MQKVAFLGLGAMGYPMAGYIAGHQNYDVTVWNRTSTKASDWAKAYNGTAEQDLHKAVQDADIIITCLGRDEDVAMVVLGETGIIDHLHSGTVLIDHTTTSYKMALELADKLATKGVRFIDSPVSGGEEGANNGQLSNMVGGDERDIDGVRDVINCYSKAISHIGPTGYGQLAKMVNQICITGVLQGLVEGLRFAEAENIDIEKLLAAIGGGAAGSWQMNNRLPTMHKREFDFGFAIKWMIKDLGYVLERSKENGSHLALTQAAYDRYGMLANEGNENKDTSCLMLHKD